MGLADLPRIAKVLDNKDLSNILAMLVKELEVINGRLDVNNIRANGIETKNLKAGAITTEKIAAGAVTANEIAANTITADKMDVDELSAISADMGKITAGEIYGAYIATSEGVAPFIEFSSTATLLKAYADALNTMAIVGAVTGNPSLVMGDGTNSGYLTFTADFTGTKKTTLAGDTGVVISSGDHVDFDTGLFNVRVQSWNNFFARSPGPGQTLQAALDSKKTVGGGFTGSIPPGSTIFVSDGEITGYI
jgi:hypothetical protein